MATIKSRVNAYKIVRTEMTQHLLINSIKYEKIGKKNMGWNYTVENNYTGETKGFLTECEAYNYIDEEIKRLNNNFGKECWSKDDFTLYKFDAENWKWREIKVT